MRYRFELLCPACHATDAVTVTSSDMTSQRFRCGDCLMERVEIVTMTIIKITEVEDVRPV